MRYQLTMLAYDMNGEPLSYGHGAPLRLRNEVQLGFKQVKWIAGIEFVADFSEIGGGYGGYNEDHEFFGYRQSDLATACGGDEVTRSVPGCTRNATLPTAGRIQAAGTE